VVTAGSVEENFAPAPKRKNVLSKAVIKAESAVAKSLRQSGIFNGPAFGAAPRSTLRARHRTEMSGASSSRKRSEFVADPSII
jgi:hypothetical protein